ncbi:hypothetical protein FBU59_000693 [Linderina macrospora]|uniref:Uncharacterized protein n=1 Tax=Linderina macrospora TaxID=4868 RepID=A0ACC1JGB5_9FUNG|nr:hypothetical protein FBU59_000693 [Linderina macrospora]
MPFISQDIYKAPPNLEWQPPAQNVQSKLIGDTEGHVRRNRDSDNDDEYGAADQYNPLAASDAKDGVQKSSVFKLGSELSKRFQKPRGAAPRASALAANSRPKHAAAQPPPPDNSAANEQTNNGDNAEDASTNSNVRPAREHKKHGGHRHGRRGSDQPTKNVLAAAMVPSMVASSVGIGMSTSAMPPNQMSFADMVDKELEKPPRPPTP